MTDSTNTIWLVELYFPATKKIKKFQLEKHLIIGRTDPNDSTTSPDVDLNDFEAEEYGVSRQHLQLNADSNSLTLQDLNSGNGTLLNGATLTAGKAYPIAHGDHITLGRLEAQLRVIISPSSTSSIQGQQRSLQLQDQSKPGSGQLVLIVEDDEMVAKLLSLMLERAGYTTITNRYVAGAIRILKQKQPSAIVLDLMLSDMNGMELCRYIRREKRLNDTPVIIISAHNTKETVDQAMKAGADIFLAKPVSSSELRHVVDSLIAHREKGVVTLNTKHLIGTAPLKALEPKSRRDTLVLFVSGYNDTPITVSLKQPVSLGRQPNTPTNKNNLDLSRFDAIDLGVSRTHAQLCYDDDAFYLEDKGSVNGSYLNGEPVRANTRVQLSNADEIRLGQLRMYVYFLTDEDFKVATN